MSIRGKKKKKKNPNLRRLKHSSPLRAPWPSSPTQTFVALALVGRPRRRRELLHRPRPPSRSLALAASSFTLVASFFTTLALVESSLAVLALALALALALIEILAASNLHRFASIRASMQYLFPISTTNIRFPVEMILQRLGGLLQQCSKTKISYSGLCLHAIITKMGVDGDLFICNHLINMYAKCNNFESARRIFNEMPKRNLISWSALIAGYDQSGRHTMAIDLFAQMKMQPNEYIYASILSSCGSLAALNQGKQVHAHALIAGYSSISFVSNSLMSMYMKCGYFDNAFSVFSNLPEPNSISYNAMITGFAENSQLDKGLELFKLMKQRGLQADRYSYVAVLGICTKTKDQGRGAGVHCQTIKLGLDISPFVGNVILTMYSKFSLITEVETAFESIREKDVVTCNTYIAACCHWGEHAKGLKLYREMEGVYSASPDDFTLTSALAACAELAYIRYGAQIHSRLIRTRIYFDVGVGNAIVSMYAKCGSIGHAATLFHCLPERNLVSWNTMIVALGNHGLGRIAVDIFEQIKAKGMVPDAITFVGLLAACSHTGLVDEGVAYFHSMKETYRIQPKIEHLSCLIDLLGRAGRLEEAEGYIMMSPFSNDLVIWGSLLSSCRLHGDVLIGERAAKKLLELQPSSSSPYVLLSNLYAWDGRWDGVAEARRLLKGSGVKKEPGHSLIAVKDAAVKFTVGDLSHSRIVEIVETLESLKLVVEKMYFLPDIYIAYYN